MSVQDEQVKRVEELLRRHGPASLPVDFKHNVMRAIAQLPDPELLTPPQGLRGVARSLRLLSAGELIAIGSVVLGLLFTLLPGISTVLEGWHWELASLDLSIGIGDLALSCSVLSIVAVAIGAAFMAGVGAYASRNHLIGA